MLQFAISAFFSPGPATIGGALLGATVMFKTGLTGEVLGISGNFRGLLKEPFSPSSLGRLFFLLGLTVSGLVAKLVAGGHITALDPAPSLEGRRTLLLVRMLVGGFFVGIGTAFSNGCTSGHGLTGLARLSPRSWVAVPTFMFTGMLAATVFGTSSALPPDSAVEFSAPSAALAAAWAGGMAAILLVAVPLARAAPGVLGDSGAKAAANLLSGGTFGCGLMLSGMVRPSKAAAFLDLNSGAWDPSLAFVMVGALALTFPFFQFLVSRMEKPGMGCQFQLPPSSKMADLELSLGAAVFGVGWGICGACPGPLWMVVTVQPSLSFLIALLGMLVGIGVWVIRQSWLVHAPQTLDRPLGADSEASESASPPQKQLTIDSVHGAATPDVAGVDAALLDKESLMQP